MLHQKRNENNKNKFFVEKQEKNDKKVNGNISSILYSNRLRIKPPQIANRDMFPGICN